MASPVSPVFCRRGHGLRIVRDRTAVMRHDGVQSAMVNRKEESTVDRGTKIYVAFLASIGLLVLLWWGLSYNPRIGELNDLLAADKVVSAYPYRFHVVDVRNGTAVLSTPRSPDVPVIRFLGIIDPDLANAPQDDPRMIKAQAALVRVQKRAAKIVQDQPDITKIQWRLDKDWWAAHGVIIPAT